MSTQAVYVSSSDIVIISDPYVIFYQLVPKSVSWSNTAQISYYIVNSTGGNIPLTDGTFYYDANSVMQTSIPAGVSLAILLNGINQWIQVTAPNDIIITGNNGTINESVPIATNSVLGVIKVGTNLTITNDGTLSAIIPQGQTVNWVDIAGKPTFSTVASTGLYSDLLGKPVLATVAISGLYSDLLSKPTFATVATSGSYTDLSNKPAINFVSLTTSGSSGAATLNSGVLNIPNYAEGGGSITLTTTGTSGPATLIGTTLNVPNYSTGSSIPTSIPVASSLGILTNGTDQTSALNTILANASYAGIIMDFSSPAAVTISGTVNCGGKMITFRPGSYFTGSGTINNAVIDAGFRQKLFDTTITLTSCNVSNRMFSVMWYGALGDGVANDYTAMQTALTYCSNSNVNVLFFPVGTYINATRGLVAQHGAPGTNPGFVSVQIVGEGTSYGLGTGVETQLVCQYSDTFAIAIIRGKGCRIENLFITGTNQLNYTQSQGWNPASTYIHGSERTNQYSPYACIVFDAFSSTVGSSDQYPGYTSYYSGLIGNGGSTDCNLTNITINGFICGIIMGPNGTTENNEGHYFDNIWLANCRDGVVTCGSQERTTVCHRFFAWNSVQTVFRTYGYGASIGGVPLIDNLNVAGNIYQIFYFAGNGVTYSVAKITNVHAESFFRIGTTGAGAIEFSTCQFNLGNDSIANGFTYPASILSAGGTIRFSSCIIIYFTDTIPRPMNLDLPIGGTILFDNCLLSAVPAGTNSLLIYTDRFNIEYRSCTFYSYSYVFNSLKNYYIPGAQDGSLVSQVMGYGSEISTFTETGSGGRNGQQIFSQKRRCINPAVNWFYVGTFALTVTGNQATFTGNIASGTVIRAHIVSGSLAGSTGPVTDEVIGTSAGAISGTTTINYIPSNLISSTYDLYVSFVSSPGYFFIGDLSATSTSVTNVYSEGNRSTSFLPGVYWANGFLNSSASVGANTITLSSAAPYTCTRALICPFEYEESGMSWCNPLLLSADFGINNILFTKGAFYKNSSSSFDDTVAGWTCTKSGVTGTPSAPEFVPIYSSDYAVAPNVLVPGNVGGKTQLTLAAPGTTSIPISQTVLMIIVNPVSTLTNFQVGTTPTGTDIVPTQASLASGSHPFTVMYYATAATTLYFQNITVSTLITIVTV